RRGSKFIVRAPHSRRRRFRGQGLRSLDRIVTPILQSDGTPRVHDKAAAPFEITLAFDDNRHASMLFGQYDQNLAKMERRLGVLANANGNHVTIKGPEDACEQARQVLETLYARVKLGQTIGLGEVEGAIQEGTLQGNLFPNADIGRTVFEQIGTRRRGGVRARNAA